MHSSREIRQHSAFHPTARQDAAHPRDPMGGAGGRFRGPASWLCGLILCLSTSAALADPTLDVYPQTIGPAGDIRLVGNGFEPSQRLMEAVLANDTGQTTLVVFDADADGSFLLDLAIPSDTVPGPYELRILDQLGAGEASHPVEVAGPPQVTLDPGSGIPGESIGIEISALQPGTVEVRLDGANVLGPASVELDSFTGTFHVPLANKGRGSAELQVLNRVGRHLFSETTVPFDVLTPTTLALELENVDLPTHTLVAGERFSVSANVIVPDGHSISDYSFSLVWRTVDGLMIPVNQQEVEVNDHTISSSGAPPSLSSGALWGLWGEDDELGYVYVTPSGESGYVRAGGIEYDYGDQQPFTVQVVDVFDEPIEDVYITLNTNTQLTDYDEDDSPEPKTRAPGTSESYLTTYEGVYQGPHQVGSAKAQLLDDTPESCPITLSHGPTDSEGEFHFVTAPGLNELANQVAKSVSSLDINTHVPAPGNPKFSVIVNGLAQGYGPVNSQGKGTVARFDFMYDWDDKNWYLRDGLDGEYDIAFNPNQGPLTIQLPEFTGELEFPGQPFISGLHQDGVVEDGTSITHIQTMVTFPDPFQWPESMFSVTPAVLRMPFNELSFGVVSDMELFLEGEFIGEFTRSTDETCSGNDVEYRAEIPDAHRLAADTTHYGSIQATLGGDQPISSEFAIVTREGPVWFLDNDTYENQVVWWEADEAAILADEIPSDNDASVDEVKHVGPMENDNASAALVSESAGGASAENSRSRSPDSDATITGNSGGSSEGNTSPEFGIVVPFGDENNEITIVDTGKIPLFRYSWGFSPIIGATFGADFWLRVFYRYWGNIELKLTSIALNFTAEPAIQAGLDVFFELSALFGLVSAKAIAQPSIGIGLPIVITNSAFNATDSKPCFNFDLDVLVELKIVVVEESFEQNIFTVAEPPDCTVGADMAMIQRIRVVAPPEINPAIATDGQGNAMAAWEGGNGLMVQEIQMGQPNHLEEVPAGPGAIKPAVASPAPGYMLMVWSQSELDPQDFDALGPIEALPHQHMVWSLRDRTGWSSVTPLTQATTGEGGPVMAACPSSDPACPAGGEVLAVWERDLAADLTQHDFRLFYSRFSGQSGAWGPVRAVHSGSTAKELGATATYSQGQPVVMWIRNDAVVRGGGTAELDLNQNRLAYRWLDEGAGVQIPNDLPMAVTSPSVDALSDGTLIATYTVSSESEAFIGNKRALHTAMGTCAGGLCTWNDREQRTSDNRVIFAEGPKVIVDDQDHIAVQFRHFGYDVILEDDPLSVQMMTGDVGQIPVVFESLTSDVQWLTQDGAVNWKVAPAFDTGSGSILSLGVNAPLAREQVRQLGLPDDALDAPAYGVTSTRLGGAAGPILHNAPRLPEFEMVDAEILLMPAESGDAGMLEIIVRNNGTPPDSGDPVTVVAAWNAPPGAGPEAGSTQVSISQPGVIEAGAMDLAPPPDFMADAPNQLFVQVNPGQAVTESDGANNTLVLATGELPVPQNLQSTTTSDSPLIYIHWDPVDDPRVTAYRIYRKNPDGEIIHVGTSDVAGFMDMSGWPGNLYEYMVASMSARAFESNKSDPIHALAQSNQYDYLFVDGFEAVPGS